MATNPTISKGHPRNLEQLYKHTRGSPDISQVKTPVWFSSSRFGLASSSMAKIKCLIILSFKQVICPSIPPSRDEYSPDRPVARV
jgi:hypothetical protein